MTFLFTSHVEGLPDTGGAECPAASAFACAAVACPSPPFCLMPGFARRRAMPLLWSGHAQRLVCSAGFANCGGATRGRLGSAQADLHAIHLDRRRRRNPDPNLVAVHRDDAEPDVPVDHNCLAGATRKN